MVSLYVVSALCISSERLTVLHTCSLQDTYIHSSNFQHITCYRPGICIYDSGVALKNFGVCQIAQNTKFYVTYSLLGYGT